MIRLREKLRNALAGGVVTLLYALGLTLTLLSATGLLSFAAMAVSLLVFLTVLLSAASMDSRAGWALGCFAAASAGIWLLMGGGAATLDVMQALVLHMSGLKSALPLVAQEAAVLFCLLCGSASWFVTQRSAGPYPALVLLLLASVLLWLGDLPGLLWYLLPTVVACVTLLLQGSHQMSAFRVMPLAVVTVLISFGGVAVGGATIPAFKQAADGLRQRIYDLFLFTGSRDVFSLAEVGYYPQGDGQLGGPAKPTKDPVMVVVTPRKAYLRGSIKNVYTGRSWEDGTQSKRYLWDSRVFSDIRSEVFDMALPQVTDLSYSSLLEPDRVIVRMLGASASSMFVPQRVRTLEPEGDVVPYFNAGSEIFATRRLAIEDAWTVEAPLMIAGDPGLANLLEACEPVADPRWKAVNDEYLSLPEHMQQEIFDIARMVTAGAETPYEMAMAIQQHLRSSYTYTLDAREQPEGMDFVATFLIKDKMGYCTHFASAMTVLCRMAGLPARYVEGFVAVPETQGERAGMAIVTGEQGHAWTEVYFKGFGWLTFDGTPVGTELVTVTPEQMAALESPEPTPVPPTATPEPSQTPEPAVTPTPTPTAEPTATPEPESQPSPEASESPAPTETQQDDQPMRVELPWGWLAAGTALLAVVVRILWKMPVWQSARQKTEFGRWLTWTQAAHDALRQMGLTRGANETPMAFLARVDALKCVPEVLSQLSGTESLMFYGHAVPLPEETQQARHAYEVVKKQLHIGRRMRMAFQRAFLPARKWDITRG